jgi:hypothetical protein
MAKPVSGAVTGSVMTSNEGVGYCGCEASNGGDEQSDGKIDH